MGILSMIVDEMDAARRLAGPQREIRFLRLSRNLYQKALNEMQASRSFEGIDIRSFSGESGHPKKFLGIEVFVDPDMSFHGFMIQME